MSWPLMPEEIRTPRLVLRPYRAGDVYDVFAYASDREWARYLPVPVPYTQEDAEQFVEGQLTAPWATNPRWAVVHDECVAGGVDVRFRIDDGVGSIGYSLARWLWGRGLMTEVVRALIDTAFTVLLQLNRLEAATDERNLASQRVMEKVGMRREGLIRENHVIRGELTSEVWYGLLRREWMPHAETAYQLGAGADRGVRCAHSTGGSAPGLLYGPARP